MPDGRGAEPDRRDPLRRRAERHRPQGDGHAGRKIATQTVKEFQEAIRDLPVALRKPRAHGARRTRTCRRPASRERLPAVCPRAVRLPGIAHAVGRQPAGRACCSSKRSATTPSAASARATSTWPRRCSTAASPSTRRCSAKIDAARASATPGNAGSAWRRWPSPRCIAGGRRDGHRSRIVRVRAGSATRPSSREEEAQSSSAEKEAEAEASRRRCIARAEEADAAAESRDDQAEDVPARKQTQPSSTKRQAEAPKQEAGSPRAERQLADEAKTPRSTKPTSPASAWPHAKINDNAYDYAKELLEQSKPELRNWEWGRLEHLAELERRDLRRRRAGRRRGLFARRQVVRQRRLARPASRPRCAHRRHDSPARHGQYVHAVAYSPDGSKLATGSSDHTIQHSECRRRQRDRERSKATPTACSRVRFSPDGSSC